MIIMNKLFDTSDTNQRDPHRLIKENNPLRRHKDGQTDEGVDIWRTRCLGCYQETLDWFLRAPIKYYSWDEFTKIGSLKREVRQMFVNPDNNPLCLKSVVEIDSVYLRIERLFYALAHNVPNMSRRSIPWLKERLYRLEKMRLDEWSEDAYSFGLVVLLTRLHENMHYAHDEYKRKSLQHREIFEGGYVGKFPKYEASLYVCMNICIAILTYIKGVTMEHLDD